MIRKFAYGCLVLQAVLLSVITVTRIDGRLLAVLEGRFMPVDFPDKVDGIILLGGSESIGLTNTLKEPVLNEDAQRIIKLAALAKKYPNAKLVLTGGNSDNNPEAVTEASVAYQCLSELGVNDLDSRVILERLSRNTYENIVNSLDLVNPKKGENWIVVTSASHVPRAMGLFRKWWPCEVFPAPTSWKTAGITPRKLIHLHFEAGRTLYRLDIVTREYIALLLYYIRGYTSELFPSPYIHEEENIKDNL